MFLLLPLRVYQWPKGSLCVLALNQTTSTSTFQTRHLYISDYIHLYISDYVHLYISDYIHLYISDYIHLYISDYINRERRTCRIWPRLQGKHPWVLTHKCARIPDQWVTRVPYTLTSELPGYPTPLTSELPGSLHLLLSDRNLNWDGEQSVWCMFVCSGWVKPTGTISLITL